MSLTNKYNLPQTLVDAASIDNHRTAGDISVSELIDAPQIRFLKKTHKIQEDISDRVWALFGTGIHSVLEKANIKTLEARSFKVVLDYLYRRRKDVTDPEKQKKADAVIGMLEAFFKNNFTLNDDRYLSENTLHFTMLGWAISMTFDLYDKTEKKLQDYKMCSVYNYMYPEARKKWEAQQNCYVYGLRENGFKVESASIVAIFRDWNKHKQANNPDYPPRAIMEIPIDIRSREFMGNYLEYRVRIHQDAMNGNVIPCDGRDRWAKAEMWAVHTQGSKRALRICDNELDALSFIEANNYKYADKLHKVIRPGEDARCENYCPVREVCPQRTKIGGSVK